MEGVWTPAPHFYSKHVFQFHQKSKELGIRNLEYASPYSLITKTALPKNYEDMALINYTHTHATKMHEMGLDVFACAG